MNLLQILPFIALASASWITFSGVLYISMIDGHTAHQNVGLSNGTLLLQNTTSHFEYYYFGGTLESRGNLSYLVVGPQGKLCLGHLPDRHFSLDMWPINSDHRGVYYYNDRDFELCGDNSVRFQSQCDGARRIQLQFEDI
ncbi:hypothetical protein JCM33374_g2263 [Metschnikowia sp. JCM 33374]|nr:hypothetical protein JCM33374_g2263 [Metschnikowia sp. JCM 33374]